MQQTVHIVPVRKMLAGL